MCQPTQFNDPPGHAPKQLSPEDATALWEEFRTGDNPTGRTALDTLYRALRKPLVSFCMMKGCDPELADEIAETAFVRLIVRRPAARRGFIPLLRKTAQNLCRDAQRQRTHAHAPLPNLSDASLSRPATPHNRDATVSERLSHDETIAAVRDCLAELDPQHRAFLIYHDIEGLSQRAACELLGWHIAPSTAHQRLARIRAQVARCLKNKNIL